MACLLFGIDLFLVGQVAQRRVGSSAAVCVAFSAWVSSMFPDSADEWMLLSVPVERVWSM